MNPIPSPVNDASLPAPPPPNIDEVSSSSPQMGGDNPSISPPPPPPPMVEDSFPTSSSKPVHGDGNLASSSVGGASSTDHLVPGSSESTQSHSNQVEEQKSYSRQPWSSKCS